MEVIMKKIIAIILCALIILPVTTYASDITAVFDEDTKEVVISGTAPSGDVILIITSDGSEVSVSKKPIDIISLRSTGSFDARLVLSTDSYGKRIVATATDKDGSVFSDAFAHPDFTLAPPVISTMISSGTLSEFMSAAEPNALILGFDTKDTIYLSSKQEIYSYLYSIIPKTNTSTPAEVIKLYRTSCALARLKGVSKTDVETVLSTYEADLGINYSDDYTNDTRISSDAKSLLTGYLSSADYSKLLTPQNNFANQFEKFKALSNVNIASNWQDIKEVMETDFASLFTLSNLTPLDAQNVYIKMMEYTYNSFSDISSNYSKAIAYVNSQKGSDTNTNVNNGPVNTGNTGSTGSSGGTISTPPVVNIELPVDNNAPGEKAPMANLNENASSSFYDVPNTHWSYNAVSALSEAKIISGYDASTFLPDNSITRAEFTKLICTSFGIPTAYASFTDVSADAWYNGYVGGACIFGIINGYGDTFNPDSYITRQDAALIVYRALKNENIVLNGSADFADRNDIALYALTAVGALKEYGIISGDGTYFYPASNITRAEAAQILYKTLTSVSK